MEGEAVGGRRKNKPFLALLLDLVYVSMIM